MELRGDLFCQEVFGSSDRCYAQLRHHQYHGLNFSEAERRESPFEYPINFFNLNVELVPPRGRFSMAEYDLQLAVTDEEVAEGTEVGPETTRANATVTIGTFSEDNDVLELHDVSGGGWIGDCVLPWGPPAEIDPQDEYTAQLEVSYDHEATTEQYGTEAIENRREQTWRDIREIYDIQGKEVQNLR